mmetsp:Transcript_85015/g.268156  ORF Transcript_85015/g.268156 Transcript_85015/m.268156 type:complete len:204 (-) Transcript_85015:88-699(-)
MGEERTSGPAASSGRFREMAGCGAVRPEHARQRQAQLGAAPRGRHQPRGPQGHGAPGRGHPRAARGGGHAGRQGWLPRSSWRSAPAACATSRLGGGEAAVRGGAGDERFARRPLRQGLRRDSRVAVGRLVRRLGLGQGRAAAPRGARRGGRRAQPRRAAALDGGLAHEEPPRGHEGLQPRPACGLGRCLRCRRQLRLRRHRSC